MSACLSVLVYKQQLLEFVFTLIVVLPVVTSLSTDFIACFECG